MTKLFKIFAMALGLCFVAVALTTIARSPAQASGTAPVSIISPLPLPVTGNTSVSGTISAQQSGTWNVGITGTPSVTGNVNVAIFRAHRTSRSATRRGHPFSCAIRTTPR